MHYKLLGRTDIKVSSICLGSMNWGEQNTEDEGHSQMDYAVDQGVNFFDTAEMYSVPGKKETQGSTECIIGSWFQKTGKRKEIILASKVTGPSPTFGHISDKLGFSATRLHDAIDKSLSRLQTDYIDLYQLHWPERKTNFFGRLGYEDDGTDPWIDNFEEAIGTLNELIKIGKIRTWGISNETSWGMMRTCQVSDARGWARPISIQNPYNLLNRSFEVGLAEMSIRENIGLLAYSPLGFGRLTGKYARNEDTAENRINKFKQMARYNKPGSLEATNLYMRIADEAGISLTHLALAFINSRPFLTSNIIGATNLDQLKENIDSVHVALSADTMQAINDVHMNITNPAP